MSLTQVMLKSASSGAVVLLAGWQNSAVRSCVTGQASQKVAEMMREHGLGCLRTAFRIGSIVEPLGILTVMVTSGMACITKGCEKFLNGNFRLGGTYLFSGLALIYASWQQVAPSGIHSNLQIQLTQTVAFGVVTNYCLGRCLGELNAHRIKAAGWGIATAIFWFTLGSQGAWHSLPNG